MRALFQLAVAVTAALIGSSVATPVKIVHPGGPDDIIIDNQDTVNGTEPTSNSSSPAPPTNGPNSGQGTQQLPFSFVNNFSGGQINAYVTGLDPNNEVVLLQPDGTFFKPTVAAGQTTPQPITQNVAIPLGGQGSTTNIKLPDYISAARVWFAAGDLQFFVVADPSGNPSLVEPSATNPSDPSANVNWGFVELTNTANGGIYANISYVDFVGMVLGMTLTGGDGSTQTAPGLQSDAVANICKDIAAVNDGAPWDQLCYADSSGTPLRVIAPSDFVAANSNSFNGYWDNYVNQVWSQYSSNPLTINTQAGAGNVSCTVSGDTLNCEGDNRGYGKPTAGDIFGCNSGPFTVLEGDNDVHAAVVPRLCAAFDRTTLLLQGGNVQPSLPASSYYSTSPTNWYSQIVHKYEVNGQGYAFPYDDVNPDGVPNASGVVSDANPQLLTVTVGGPSS
jgi:Beta-1,3-glucanase